MEFELLEAQNYKNITAIPITRPTNYGIDLLTLKKAFKLDLCEVKECERSIVNTIIIKNKSVTPLLIIDGEEIEGGDQNRIVNGSIIIDCESQLPIPVNCTEKGRWGFKKEFEPSAYMANHKTRFSRAAARFEDLDTQAPVWDSINELEISRGFASPTSAMKESYDNAENTYKDSIESFEICDDQCGIVLIVDGEIKGFEMFLNSEIYRDYHEKIIKSYLIDSELNDEEYEIGDVKDFIDNALNSHLIEKNNIGLEEHYEFEFKEGIGSVCKYMGETIHLSYITSI